MPGQAARMGDQTTHGGVITQGAGTVFIGGKPAARMGDMQSCPLVSGTVPHAVTPIMQGVPSVLIEGKPAACMGDIVGPPCAASILMGDLMVSIGTSPPGNAATASEEPKKEDKHKFKAVVKDSEGNILTNEDFHFTAPDGKVIQGKTTQNGEMFIEDLPEGICKVQVGDYEIKIKG